MLKIYGDNVEAIWKNGLPAVDYWCHTIGELQQKLPVHCVYQYCRNNIAFADISSQQCLEIFNRS